MKRGGSEIMMEAWAAEAGAAAGMSALAPQPRPYPFHPEADHTQTRRFSPYEDNGGTAVAIAGKDFVVCVADTRLNSGMGIATRNWCRWLELAPGVVLASSGMQADIAALQQTMKQEVATYVHKHKRSPSLEAVGQLLSTVLYNRRFFPIYSFNILVGANAKGEGECYEYDAIGSFHGSRYGATGSGAHLALGVLDNLVRGMHRAGGNHNSPWPILARAEAVDVAKDVLASVAERDVHTGDGAHVLVMDTATKELTVSHMPLRQD